MLSTLIWLIFTLVIAGVLWWAFQQLIDIIPLAEPFRKIVYVLMVLVGVLIVLYVIQMLLTSAGVAVPWPRLSRM